MRDDIAAVANLTLEQYKDVYLTFLAAFNRQDLAAAFAVLAPECEFRPIKELLGERVLIGPDEVRRFFDEAFDVLPDWHVESPVRILQATDNTFVTLDRGRGRGRGSGAQAVFDFDTVAELRDLVVVRVQQYSTWEEGLGAAGLDPSIAADVRKSARSGG